MRQLSKVLLGIALLLVVGITAYIWHRAYESPWHSALSVVERERLFQIIRDNSHNLEKAQDFTRIQAGMEIKFIRPFASPELAIVNFNTQRLCGTGGCLYAIYETDKPANPIFRWLLDANLPHSVPLFSSSSNCLVVHQKAKAQLVRLQYCHSGKSSYVQRDKSFLDTPRTH